MIITFTNVIGAIRTAFSVVRSGLKMWLGFETSETLGREEVVNGDFASNTWWTVETPEVEISNDKVNFNTTLENYGFYRNNLLTTGKQYEVVFTIDSYTGGAVHLNIGGVHLTTPYNSEDTFTAYITGGGSNVFAIQSNSGGAILSINNVSVKELTQITPDKSGNNNVGELFTGKALDFDGSTSYITGDGFAGTLSTDDAFTIVMWFKSNQVSQSQPYQNIQMSGLKSDGATNVFKFGASANSTLKGIHYQDTAGASNNYKINDNVNYNDNVWHRLVITRGFGSGYQTANFYVDGVNIGNCPSQIVWDDLAKFSIGQEYDGGNTPSDFFKGLISDVQIYDKDWLQADVTFDYANPNKLAIDNPSTSLNVTNLKAYWALSEGDGLVAYDSGTNLEEEEVVNGDFATDSDWTKQNGSTINDVANVANVIAGGSIGSSGDNWSLESITNVFEPSKTYQIKFKAKQVIFSRFKRR